VWRLLHGFAAGPARCGVGRLCSFLQSGAKEMALSNLDGFGVEVGRGSAARPDAYTAVIYRLGFLARCGGPV